MAIARTETEIDVTNWEFCIGDIAGKVAEVLGNAVTEALQNTFEDNPVMADFSRKEPLTVEIVLPLSPEEIVYRVTVESMVDDVFEDFALGGMGSWEGQEVVGLDEEGFGVLKMVSAELRRLADKIDRRAVLDDERASAG